MLKPFFKKILVTPKEMQLMGMLHLFVNGFMQLFLSKK